MSRLRGPAIHNFASGPECLICETPEGKCKKMIEVAPWGLKRAIRQSDTQTFASDWLTVCPTGLTV